MLARDSALATGKVMHSRCKELHVFEQSHVLEFAFDSQRAVASRSCSPGLGGGWGAGSSQGQCRFLMCLLLVGQFADVLWASRRGVSLNRHPNSRPLELPCFAGRCWAGLVGLIWGLVWLRLSSSWDLAASL